MAAIAAVRRAVTCGPNFRTLSFASRCMSQVSFVFITPEGERVPVVAQKGDNLLEVAHNHSLDIEGACGGECACSTCHVVLTDDVFEALPEPDLEEEDMLDLAAGLTDTSRLGCQVVVVPAMEGMEVTIPSESHSMLEEEYRS